MPVIAPKDPYVLLEDSLGTDASARSYLFTRPKTVIACRSGAELMPRLRELEAAIDAGYYAAGWIAYEAGYWFEPKLAPLRDRDPSPQPLFWFGIFEAPQILQPAELESFWERRPIGTCDYAVEDLGLSLSEVDYRRRIGAIKDYLAAGDIYQVNFTLQRRFRLDGNVERFHRVLRESQRVPYGAAIATGEEMVLSYSPELFLKKRGRRLTAMPMKGTAPRGLTYGRDLAIRRHLRADPKSRAENLMIVDLLRNDLGRLADVGSVRVSDLYKVEPYRTVLQMTSTVHADADRDLGIIRLLTSLFPCGSVTGAPKIRAMEVIAELEPIIRGVYTGAIGFITPKHDFTFSVPIRTLYIDGEGQGTLGIGSGIVADSDAGEEYRECLLKGSFFTEPEPGFELIETMRAEDGKIDLLDLHLKRLRASARLFGFKCPEAKLRGNIEELLAHDAQDGLWRLRLLLSRRGESVLSAIPYAPPAAEPLPSVVLAQVRVRRTDPFLYHKTTRRTLYNRALAEAQKAGHFDMIFCNTDGEVTEGARSNVVIEKNGELLTPPVESGLLPGVYRAHLLAEGGIKEAVITPRDIQEADALYLCNALAGLIPVRLAHEAIAATD